MTRRRVLLLATTTGYQTRSFGEAAERLGVELVFATDRCMTLDDPWRDGAIPIRFHDEAQSVAAILDVARMRPIDGVLVVGDRPTVIAAHVQRALGLPGHSPDAAQASRNKLLTRERLRATGLSVPWFYPVTINGSAPDPRSPIPDPGPPIPDPLSFPCIVKPTALSGSRGVMRADDADTFAAAFDRLRRLLTSPEVRAERDDAHHTALVEGFIPGREYAVEGLLHHGALQVLAIFDKPDPLDGPFFEETIYVTPSSAPAAEQDAIARAIADAAAALGLHHGPVHAECRVNGEGVFVLEVAARPIGGLCARALRFSESGISNQSTINNQHSAIALEELLLRHALGADPREWQREAAASGVMMIPIPRRGLLRGVAGLERAQRVPCIEDVRITAKPDQRLVPLPEGASYLGFIFARGDTPARVECALRTAHAQLTFNIDAELPVLAASQTQYNHDHG